MEKDIENAKNWLSSKDVEKAFKTSSCDLAHLRQEGKLLFTKKGNSFLYDKKDVQNVLNKKLNKIK